MESDNPTLVDPISLAKLGKSISGVVEIAKLHRFSDLAKFGKQDVNYLMSFLSDEKGRCYIEGKAKVVIQLKCNRCLNLFAYEVQATFLLYPVESYNVKDSSQLFDIVVMRNGLISIIDIIEDELILNLPEVPRHAEDDPDCRSLQTAWLSVNSVEQQGNPFVELKDLHKTDKK